MENITCPNFVTKTLSNLALLCGNVRIQRVVGEASTARIFGLEIEYRGPQCFNLESGANAKNKAF